MTQTRVLVVGGSSFLGSHLVRELSAMGLSVDSADRARLDLSQPIPPVFRESLRAAKYRYVVICAAITDVERCFREPELSNRTNVTGTIELIQAVQDCGAIPVFFSSDYVFGPRVAPAREDDPRRPQAIYGHQKLAVEQHLEAQAGRSLLFRTSKLMSKTRHPRNILVPILQQLSASKTMRCFEDQWINPVFVEDIARVLEAAFEQDLHGVFHLGTRRLFSRAELADFLARKLGFDPELIERIRISDLRFSEPRSSHDTLECGKIASALPFRFTEIEDAITELRALVG